MESFLVRYRNLLVLLSILLAQIIGWPRRCTGPAKDAIRSMPAIFQRAADQAMGQCAGFSRGTDDSFDKDGGWLALAELH